MFHTNNILNFESRRFFRRFGKDKSYSGSNHSNSERPSNTNELKISESSEFLAPGPRTDLESAFVDRLIKDREFVHDMKKSKGPSKERSKEKIDEQINNPESIAYRKQVAETIGEERFNELLDWTAMESKWSERPLHSNKSESVPSASEFESRIIKSVITALPADFEAGEYDRNRVVLALRREVVSQADIDNAIKKLPSPYMPENSEVVFPEERVLQIIANKELLTIFLHLAKTDMKDQSTADINRDTISKMVINILNKYPLPRNFNELVVNANADILNKAGDAVSPLEKIISRNPELSSLKRPKHQAALRKLQRLLYGDARCNYFDAFERLRLDTSVREKQAEAPPSVSPVSSPERTTPKISNTRDFLAGLLRVSSEKISNAQTLIDLIKKRFPTRADFVSFLIQEEQRRMRLAGLLTDDKLATMNPKHEAALRKLLLPSGREGRLKSILNVEFIKKIIESAYPGESNSKS